MMRSGINQCGSTSIFFSSDRKMCPTCQPQQHPMSSLWKIHQITQLNSVREKNPGNSSDNDLGSNKKWGKENKVEMVGMTKRFLKHGFYAKNKEVMKNEWSGKVKELKKMKNHFSLLK